MTRRFTGKKKVNSTEERGAVAAYIAEMLDELAIIANKNDMPLLVYFVRICELEAESIAKSEGHAPPVKQSPDSGARH